MKLVFVAIFALTLSFGNAQVNQVNLDQTDGRFVQENITLTPGDYQFNISNTDVDHEVGFVLVPKGKTGPENHIKNAYVTAPVKSGASSPSKVVTLSAGEYEYFCPLNPTPKYTLTVRDDVEPIKLTQVEGGFENQEVTVSEGSYQFEIVNNGVDHEVGFVLVPKGKYDASNHIKAAYVTAPVADGSSSKTGIVELSAGEYEYFCPLNPTPKYTLTVLK